jgi:cation:H+ antiporter
LISRLIFTAGLPTWALFLELAVAGAIVVWSGARLTKAADSLSDHLQLGAGWMGLILLATVTSLPELITGGTAVWIGNVDMAFGSILGSCAFNVTIIVLLNALIGGGSVLVGVSAAHALSSSFGILLMGLALTGLVVSAKFAEVPALLAGFEWAWAATIFATYLGCVRLCYRFERRGMTPEVLAVRGRAPGHLYGRVVMLALIIVAASWWLARCGDILSVHEIKSLGRPLGATFVGACFLALATSLPEITTSVAAVRIGNLDMALGNIFGSNMFNIFVIPCLKGVACIRGGALLAPGAVNVSQSLLVGLLAMLLTAIAVGGLTYKSTGRMFRRFGFDSVMIAVAYAGGMILLLAA